MNYRISARGNRIGTPINEDKPNTMIATTTQSLHGALQEYFGFDQFKGQQEEIIASVLAGIDTFVIMPTGGGKSLCYQLPALMMDGCALVISPLIALMKNQVDSIRGYGSDDNVAHFLNSSLTRSQMKQVKQDISDGHTKILYIAPETLTKEENIEFFRDSNISFVAVDEAHCISEWGHDFRPEYRRIRTMIDEINKEIPVVALTATATPKVQLDIVKNLHMENENIFISSFNRDNLYYEVRPKGKKEATFRDIVQVVKSMPDQSGIIYVQARKSTEEIAEVLRVNGVRAVPYHAGLDAKTRSRTQDDFLMERTDVIVATIAFGMGIDKPDVRFVIHFNIPKSIENYYQETGRAGRDGLEGKCVAYYSHKDIQKLEKFLRDKPVAEREMGAQLMQEVEAYAETTACRRKFLLHYFGEDYGKDKCMLCDNCLHPKKKVEVTDDMRLALEAVVQLEENYKIDVLVDYVMGKGTKTIQDYKFDKRPLFGKGKSEDKNQTYWESIFRHALLNNLLRKDIETYGLLKLTEKGQTFIDRPHKVEVPINHNYDDLSLDDGKAARASVLDETLVRLLRDVRRREAEAKNVPPYVIFQDPSINEMATVYPITMDDMKNISGVSKSKAQRYARPFLEVIRDYVEENDILRAADFVVKQVAKKSKAKVNIIQSVDRKIALPDIARSNNMNMEELMDELYAIVTSGTKLDLDYYIEDAVDEYSQEEIYEYFMEAKSDDVDTAFRELQEDDVTLEEVQLMRIKFMSEMAN